MKPKNFQHIERGTDREQSKSDELVERIARAINLDGKIEPIKGLHLHRASSTTESVHGVSIPAFCVIAQGSKVVFLGENRYQYDPAHYLLATVELPTVSQIIEASPEKPYLSLRLELDLTVVGSVMVEAGHVAPRGGADIRAIQVSPLDANLLDAVVRLVRLLDTPSEARFLYPLITREIIYRLLQGEQGDLLRRMATQGGQTYRVVKAIERLRDEFDQPLRIDEIAREIGMSVSGFHHHFKAVTGMSPLQFQKRQRLQEARRLMLGEHLDAASTAYRVGYDDASHFNREYKRLFGAPPMRDVERLREAAWQSSVAGTV
jgi:AraC-like DNA-binding protein